MDVEDRVWVSGFTIGELVVLCRNLKEKGCEDCNGGKGWVRVGMVEIFV